MDRFEDLTQFDFHHRMEECRDTCLIFFTAEGCSSCRAWRKILAGYRARHPGVRVYQVDAQLEQALVQEFEVFHLPALFLYHQGRFHSQIQCAAGIDEFAAAIAAALARPAEDSP